MLQIRDCLNWEGGGVLNFYRSSEGYIYVSIYAHRTDGRHVQEKHGATGEGHQRGGEGRLREDTGSTAGDGAKGAVLVS